MIEIQPLTERVPAIPDLPTAHARLPATYEKAKRALAACLDLDEAKDWADKAAALASYARQSEDDTLEKHAMRIRARAIRRCGELLKTYDARPHNAEKQSTATDTLISQKQAATDAGLSKRQQVTAVRVANVPEPDFEAAIEGPQKVTVTSLAERGKRVLEEPKPKGFAVATQLIGEVADFARFCAENDPVFVAGGVYPDEVREVRSNITAIDGWLDRLIVNLKG